MSHPSAVPGLCIMSKYRTLQQYQNSASCLHVIPFSCTRSVHHVFMSHPSAVRDLFIMFSCHTIQLYQDCASYVHVASYSYTMSVHHVFISHPSAVPGLCVMPSCLTLQLYQVCVSCLHVAPFSCTRFVHHVFMSHPSAVPGLCIMSSCRTLQLYHVCASCLHIFMSHPSAVPSLCIMSSCRTLQLYQLYQVCTSCLHVAPFSCTRSVHHVFVSHPLAVPECCEDDLDEFSITFLDIKAKRIHNRVRVKFRTALDVYEYVPTTMSETASSGISVKAGGSNSLTLCEVQVFGGEYFLRYVRWKCLENYNVPLESLVCFVSAAATVHKNEGVFRLLAVARVGVLQALLEKTARQKHVRSFLKMSCN
ncbi:hypothetical protein ElyMa_006995300 [Elysia marginata]|uniref:Uncharacterized protein n=1 Tax=Elysia marginata TaxID=1093978 RepID=A0AAV4JT80_9GAST|nr:hypothetical protein ElyMa_006995300 [Elysia marginata]